MLLWKLCTRPVDRMQSGRQRGKAFCVLETLKLRVNFVIYIADRIATTCTQAKLFLLRCVNPAALPPARCYSIRLPRRVASSVSCIGQRTESSSEHYVSDLSLLKLMRYDVKISSAWFEPITYGSKNECAIHYTTAPQRRSGDVQVYSRHFECPHWTLHVTFA